MRIPKDAQISREKLTGYLLVRKPEDDKSQFLDQAGFTQDNPADLETAIRQHASASDALLDRSNQFGEYYVVHGDLVRTDGRLLAVTTVWIRDAGSETIRFVTLKPRK